MLISLNPLAPFQLCPMVSSPEISRLNGRKSRGPRTERGKAIASRNATKHGLLSQGPPLLVTEDLTTFEGMVQSLIEHYQPEGPVEHFLVQQAAMGMLKQYRLWSAEAAIANAEILQAQYVERFPDIVTAPEVIDTFEKYREKRTPLKEALAKERSILAGLIEDLEFDVAHQQERGEAATLEAFRESIGHNYYHEKRTAAVYECCDEFDEWLCRTWNERRKKHVGDVAEAIAQAEYLVKLARERVAEIDHTLAEMEAMTQAIAQATKASQGVQKPELFTRYQREISRELYEALDRLAEMQQQRNH
jgi:hypothetical protein